MQKYGSIYLIRCLINNKFYIGKTERSVRERFHEHLVSSGYRNSKGYNYPLYRAIRKYGEKNFIVQILMKCPIEKLNEKEIYYIKKFKPQYNIMAGGNGGSTTHRFKWITNGKKDRYILKGKIPPKGWKFGHSFWHNSGSPPKEFIIIFPNGIEQRILNLRKFCKKYNLDRNSLRKVAKGKLTHHKGFKLKFIENGTDSSIKTQ